MEKKYIIIGLMALILSGIIFSLIFLLLLRDKKKNKQFSFKLEVNTSLLDEVDKFLKYGGYWLSLEAWLGMQLLFFITACIVGLSQNSTLNTLKNSFFVFLGLELLLFIAGKYEIKNRNDVLNLDLCRLQETLFFQSDTNVDKENILLAVYEDLKDPSFKKAVKDIVFAYSLKQDVILKIEHLKTISNNMNLIVFSNTLIQDFQIGEAAENIEAQATVMRRLISNRTIIEKKSARFKMIVIGIVLMMLYVFLAVTPLILEFTSSINRITN